jgi:ribosomal protein L12E/L44/L45/RPP1/RPP2
MIHVVLSPAEKFREMVGEEASSKSGKFTFLNCFDMGSGSLACGVKEGVKLYVYNLRSVHVERVRQHAIENALAEAISEGLTPADAAKQAQKVGAKAAKLASRQAKRILGPIISSGWDFFEAMYYGGTMTEGFLRGTGTLLGTYMGGFHGEQRMGGKIGYLLGSHVGSWIGARMGLMVYDVINGVSYLVSVVQPEESYQSQSSYGDEYRREEISEESQYYERPDEEAQESEGFSLF